MRTFRDRVAVVTGAASGIGRALSQALAAEGCHLALVDREPIAPLPGTSGSRVTTHRLDVADRPALESLLPAVLDAHGAVHLLVNNAGVSLAGPLADCTLDDLDWVLRVNLHGTVFGTRLFLPTLLRQQEAHIVTVSSVFGLLGFRGKSAYCATKFALRGFTESLRAELAHTPVGVTCVYPGAVATALLRTGRATDAVRHERETRILARRGASPARIAGLMVDAIRHNRPRLRIGPETLAIDALTRLCPVVTAKLAGWASRRMAF